MSSFIGNFLPSQVHHGIQEGNNLLLPGIAELQKENKYLIQKVGNLETLFYKINRKLDSSCTQKR